MSCFSVDGADAADLHRVGVNDAAQLHAAGVLLPCRQHDLGVVAGAVAEKLRILRRHAAGAADLGSSRLGSAAAYIFFVLIDNKKDLGKKIEVEYNR